jgi:hypothetical protein
LPQQVPSRNAAGQECHGETRQRPWSDGADLSAFDPAAYSGNYAPEDPQRDKPCDDRSTIQSAGYRIGCPDLACVHLLNMPRLAANASRKRTDLPLPVRIMPLTHGNLQVYIAPNEMDDVAAESEAPYGSARRPVELRWLRVDG